jgi:hypothetical protein
MIRNYYSTVCRSSRTAGFFKPGFSFYGTVIDYTYKPTEGFAFEIQSGRNFHNEEIYSNIYCNGDDGNYAATRHFRADVYD